MNYDTLAVILTVIVGWWALHRDIVELRNDMSGIKERIARMEGSMEVLKELFQKSLVKQGSSESDP